MLLDSKPYTLDRIARMILKLLILLAVIAILDYFSEVLIPFAVAFLLAYLINPLVTTIQRRVKRRGVAVAMGLVVVVAVFTGLVLFLTPLILREFSAMIPFLSKIEQAHPPDWLIKLLPNVQWDQWLQRLADQDMREMFQSERFQELFQNMLRRVLPGVWNVITGTISFIIGLIGLAVILLYMIFLLIDYDKIKETWPDYLPPGYRARIIGFVHDFNEAMKRYFRGQAIIASIVGCLFAFGFWLIGLPLGIFLGLFIGLLNMVPYLQIVGLIPAFLLAFLSSIITGVNPWQMPLLTLLVFAVVQVLQDLVLTPKILGKATGLSPAVILLSLAIWGKLLGFLGLLIAIPMSCLVLAYYQRFIVPPDTSREGKKHVPPVVTAG
ncbi:MAG: AI-2E family transporter [Kiritimatiellae bacterium]|nr:AI-2E family transporter [Kiritimatiellia bacterium]